MKPVKIGDFSISINNAICTVHKQILKTSKERNNCNEVTAIMNIATGKIGKFEFGDDNKTIITDQKNIKVIEKGLKNSVVLCHSHPKGGDFSFEDINEFMKYDSIKAMTIITNDGRVMSLYKTKSFDKVKMYYKMLDIYGKTFTNKKDKQKVVDIFMKNLYYAGIKRR